VRQHAKSSSRNVGRASALETGIVAENGNGRPWLIYHRRSLITPACLSPDERNRSPLSLGADRRVIPWLGQGSGWPGDARG